MKTKTRESIKLTDDLVKHDEILVGGHRAVIVDIKTNDFGHYVLRCGIVGARTKKRNQLTLIIPDNTSIITYK